MSVNPDHPYHKLAEHFRTHVHDAVKTAVDLWPTSFMGPEGSEYTNCFGSSLDEVPDMVSVLADAIDKFAEPENIAEDAAQILGRNPACTKERTGGADWSVDAAYRLSLEGHTFYLVADDDEVQLVRRTSADDPRAFDSAGPGGHTIAIELGDMEDEGNDRFDLYGRWTTATPEEIARDVVRIVTEYARLERAAARAEPSAADAWKSGQRPEDTLVAKAQAALEARRRQVEAIREVMRSMGLTIADID